MTDPSDRSQTSSRRRSSPRPASTSSPCSATAVVPTTFMRPGRFQHVTVHSTGEAQRRMVDLSLVLDVSGSIGSRWPAVSAAAAEFIDAFDDTGDRLALITYGNGAQVVQQMPSTRGFNKSAMIASIPSSLPGGWTPMAEGLYRGWDELRSVPNGSQSGSASSCCSPTARPTACLDSGTGPASPRACRRRTSRSDRQIRTTSPRAIPSSRACTTRRAATEIRRSRSPEPTTWTGAST